MADGGVTCRTCKWWQGDRDKRVGIAARSALGECRATPPVAQKGNREGVWPKTRAAEWCGMHDDGKGGS